MVGGPDGGGGLTRLPFPKPWPNLLRMVRFRRVPDAPRRETSSPGVAGFAGRWRVSLSGEGGARSRFRHPPPRGARTREEPSMSTTRAHTWMAPLFAALAACGGEPTLAPSESPRPELSIVSGDEQQGPAGDTLERPLVVRVGDGQGGGIEGTPVAWRISSGAGSFFAEAAGGPADSLITLTDAEGLARISFRPTWRRVADASVTGSRGDPAHLDTRLAWACGVMSGPPPPAACARSAAFAFTSQASKACTPSHVTTTTRIWPTPSSCRSSRGRRSGSSGSRRRPVTPSA